MELRHGSPEVQGLAQQAALDVVAADSFFEDVPSGPLESIEHFCRSNQSYQRLAYAQGIAAAAAAPTAEYEGCVDQLLPVIQQLARDHEAEIRSTAVKQMPGLGTALYAKDAERSMRDIESTLLVCAQQCALDDEDEVSHAAILAFQQLVQLLPPARATAASKRAVDRLESTGSDDGTLAAVRLLAHTVGFWTPEALRRHVPRYIGRWASHREFSVREAVATCMSLVVPAMPVRLCHQVLLPAFYQLSRDQNWRVRRACALDLPRLAGTLQQRSAAAASSHASGGLADEQSEGLVEQHLGSCSSKASSCLSPLQRFGTEVGSSSSTALAASLAAAAGPQRNKSYPSLIANRSPATSAQIMTKHPMHSSLIMDGLLSGSSSCNSMPGSPSGSSATSLALDHHDEVSHTHHEQQRGALSDNEQQPEQQAVSHCALEQDAGLLHDCWCALRQCMELLTADSSHWVKVAALSGLGPFLLQLPHCQLGQLLLGRFMSMAGSTVVIYEVSVALACAQAFGQLAVLLGADRWADMRDAWHALQSSRDPQVLCEVVSCLPQLMAALGPVLTHREMLPALAALLQSHLTWVAGQLVQVMADLLQQLPPSGHEMLLKTIPQLAGTSAERPRSWRVRRDLALQLGRLAAVAGPDAIENCLWPTAMSLCCDPVAAVRSAAASQIGPVMAVLPPHMLQAEGCDAAAESCEACCRQSSSGSLRQAVSRNSSCGHEAMFAEATVAAAAAAASVAAVRDAAAVQQDSNDSMRESHSQANTSQGSTVGATTGLNGQSGKATRSSSGKARGFGVRFALDDSSGISSTTARSNSMHEDEGRPSLLSGFAADGRSRSSGSCSSSFDSFDELELPSALAPAPAGCFTTHSDSGDDSDEAAAAEGVDSGSSGLSSSSSHSSDSADAHDSASSSSDESGNDSSDSDSDEEHDSSSSSHRWRGTMQEYQPESGLGQGSSSSSSHQGTPSAGAADRASVEGSSGLDVPASSTAAAPQRPLHTMHPAMMPVGTLSAAAAAPRAVPAAKRRPMPNRARSTGDLLRLHSRSTASSDDGAGHLQNAVALRFTQQQHGTRQLADSLPTSLLAMDPGSEDEAAHSSCWRSSLPQPAHAAPHQYLPCLVEYFGCSSSHQQRQLFVPLVMGLLACCHKTLSCAQQAMLLDRLEALAHDSVPGVRYAVAAALSEVKVQAAALTGQQHQALQQQQSAQDEPLQQAPRQQQQLADAAAGTSADNEGLNKPEAAEEPAQQLPTEPADTATATGAAEHTAVADDRNMQAQGQEQQQQQSAKPEGQQEQEASPQGVQAPVSHVPKGAHPLLGYQAYVQQLARQSSVTSPTHTGNSSGSSGGGRSSPRVKVSAAAPSSTTAAAAAALPPRGGTTSVAAASSSGGSRQEGKHPTPSSKHQVAVTPAATAAGQADKARPAAAGGAGQQVVDAAGGTGPVGAAAGGTGPVGAAAAGGEEEAKSAEWLMRLSNCQQLERLMHVVALTTGPL